MAADRPAAIAPLRVRAEAIAGRMSIGPLTPAESEKGVDIIFDLLKENHRLGDEIERRAAENARLSEGTSRLIAALWRVYEQAQSVARKPSPNV